MNQIEVNKEYHEKRAEAADKRLFYFV